MSLLHPNRPSTTQAPHLDRLMPRAAIPGGSFEIFGSHLLPATNDGPQQASSNPQLPSAAFGDTTAYFDLVRANRALLRVPEGAIASDLTLRANGLASNVLHANIAVPMADELHLVSNPAVDADGNLFAMISGPRGDRVPVSIVRIGRDLQARPFARDLLNVTALAFGPDSYLYASSRAEGTVYRISPEGDHISTFAEGMGVATGIAFDHDGNLFVGDRSGTIFKVGPYGSRNPGEVFVFATLEPSVAAYHLAFRDDGILLVAAPSDQLQPAHLRHRTERRHQRLLPGPRPPAGPRARHRRQRLRRRLSARPARHRPHHTRRLLRRALHRRQRPRRPLLPRRRLRRPRHQQHSLPPRPQHSGQAAGMSRWRRCFFPSLSAICALRCSCSLR